jgi:calmodulin
MSSLQHRLTEEERAEFKEIFDLVDEDRGGTISKHELKKLMDTLRLHPTEEELSAMMKAVDADGSGDIDFEEFVTVMSRRVQADYTPEQLRSAFKVFETENMPSGYVATDVLQHALTTYGTDKISREEAAELLQTVDPERTGRINYMDFIAMMSAS